MSRLIACRACLSPDVYVCPAPRQYVDQFEILTNLMMQSPDRKPLGLCRLCCHYLRKYHKFREWCLQADAKLNQLLLSYTQETPEINISTLAPELKWTPIHKEQIPLVLETKVKVKQEYEDSEPLAHPQRCVLETKIEVKQECEDSEPLGHLQSQSKDELEQEVDDANSHLPVYCGNEECTMKYAERNGDQVSIDGENEEDETGSVTFQLELDPKKIITELPSTFKTTKLREKCSYDDACKLKIYSFYVCDHCNRKFTSKAKLRHHIAEHLNTKYRNPGDKPYQCPVCQKYFSKNWNLKRHSLIHTGEKPYQCQVFENSLSQNQYSKQHLRIHTGYKPYQCQVCEKSFSQNKHLKQHLRIHTGDKPYQCPVCEKSFNQIATLNAHLPIHTGDKPYQCQVCQKSFSRNQNLKQHLRIHTGDKPYQCQVCKKSFSQNQHLKQHLWIHT